MKIAIALGGLSGLLAATSVWAQTSQFLFQDSITGLTNGVYDFQFRLYDSLTNATGQVGTVFTAGDIPLTNGLYSVVLDFGTTPWTGQDLWIEVQQRVGTSTGAYTLVPPREQVLPTPYAISMISGSVRNPTFIGTTDATNSLTLSVNSVAALRLQYPSTGTVPILIGGSSGNFVAPNAHSSVIGGGGGAGSTSRNSIGTNSTYGAILGGRANAIAESSSFAGIVSGDANKLGVTGVPSSYSFIGGGQRNLASGLHTVLVGGNENTLTNARFAAIVGGDNNAIFSGANNSFIGSGYANSISASATHAVISGGSLGNVASAYGFLGGGNKNTNLSPNATLVAGKDNRIGTGSDSATIGGGNANIIRQSGTYSVIGGGVGNAIGTNASASIVAGGYYNSIGNNADYASLGGGQSNRVDSIRATISGGSQNIIASSADYAGIVSGDQNRVGIAGLTSTGSFIGGGLQNTNIGAYSVVVGGSANGITNSGYAGIVVGDRNVIGAAANHSFIGGGLQNTIQANANSAVVAGGTLGVVARPFSFLGGGNGNTNLGSNATLVGGGKNLLGNSSHSTLAGGATNTIGESADYGFLGGGTLNTVGTNSDHSVLVGGAQNRVASLANFALIGGGQSNLASGSWAAIPGGFQNTAAANYAIVGGGQSNLASGSWSAIPGGFQNTAAANYSMAMGQRAKANHAGSLVWGDSTAEDVQSDTNNSVTFRASGGYRFFSSTNTTGTVAGVSLPANSSSWGTVSDRNVKTDFAPVDDAGILERLVQVPVLSWRYNWDEPNSVPHIGPMAQDFKAAFYPGRDDTSITTLEFDGVELAAIQGLNKKVEAQGHALDNQLRLLQAENAELKRRLANLERAVKRLTEK